MKNLNILENVEITETEYNTSRDISLEEIKTKLLEEIR